MGGFADRSRCRFVFVLLAQVVNDVFHHHHRAFHYHSEVQRAERKQIGRNIVQLQADGREQQRERDGQRNDERAAHVAEKNEQDERYKKDAFGQVMKNSVSGVLDQFAAVEERNDFHARRKDLFVQLFNFGVNAVERGFRFSGFAQQNDAFDHI